MPASVFEAPTGIAGGLFLLDLVDEIDEVAEPSPRTGADDGGDAEMGLAGSPDNDAVPLGAQESAGCDLAASVVAVHALLARTPLR